MGKLIATALIGLVLAMIGKYAFGINHPLFNFSPNIYINTPSASKPDPAQENARRAAEEKRRHDEQLAAIRRQEAEARATAEANRQRLEAERAAAEVEATRQQQRQRAEAEMYARAQRVKAWRDANGGCDPPMRRQCMTVGSSGGGPRQVLGCTCVR